DPGWLVTLSASTNLADGQLVSVNIRARSDVTLAYVEIRECRTGVTYLTDADIDPRSGKCPYRAVSSSSDEVVSRYSVGGLNVLAHRPEGATIPFRVGIGVADWGDPAIPVMTCDPTHPCNLVVQVKLSNSTGYAVKPLTFAEAD